MDLTPTNTELKTALAGARTVVVAFSGGADSLMALELAAETAPDSCEVIAWYCHHYPTPVEPDRQAAFDLVCQRILTRLGARFRFVMHKADIDRIAARLGYSWEHTASLVRRKYLLRFADRHAANGLAAVITGHNFSDYLETLTLRRARQIPEEALPALAIADLYTGFLRPLYKMTRERVRAAAAERGFTAYEDPANTDMQFARNRIRVSAAEAKEPTPNGATAIQTAALRHVHRRELHLTSAEWGNMQNTERARTVFAAFRSLAIVKKFTRNHFARAHSLPFRLPPFFAHKENTTAGDTVVFRRGLGICVALPEAEAAPYLRGDQVTGRITIAAPFGHKSVAKLFSERRLSPRERRRTLVYLSAAHSNEAVRVAYPAGANL